MEYGYKGKGSTIHMITDGGGNPMGIQITSAKDDERKQVEKLIKKIEQVLPEEEVILEADKGYDSRELRFQLIMQGIYPLIPYRKKDDQFACWIKRIRWKVERAISWLKRAYRRVATRWERLVDAYTGVTLAALCYFWIRKIVG